MTKLRFYLLLLTVFFCASQEARAQRAVQPQPYTTQAKKAYTGSNGEQVQIEIILNSNIARGNGWAEYIYQFTNNSNVTVRLMPSITENKHLHLIGSFITDARKLPENRVGMGEVIITIPPNKTTVFSVKDDSKFVVGANVMFSLLDEKNKSWGSFPGTIFFPAWENIFGK